MKPIKLIHLSDVHFRPDRKAEALASLQKAYDVGLEEFIDLFVISGDLYDRALYNTKNSGLPELQRMIQKMMDLAPIVAVSGTPSHDSAGCYEILQETNAEHSFTLLDPHHTYFFMNDGEVYDSQDAWPDAIEGFTPVMLILGCPEPGKEWFVKGKQIGGAESDQKINEGMRNILLGFGALRKQYPDIPCLFVFHGQVRDTQTCNGHRLSGGIEIGKDDLALVGADYYALGHIHLSQQIGEIPAYYAGSAYPVDWGETDLKGFYIVDFIDGKLADYAPCRTDFSHPPRMKFERFWPDISENGQVAKHQAWLDIKVPREKRTEVNENLLLTKMIEEWGALEGSKVTVSILPTETVRAGEIQIAKSLTEKVIVYSENSSQKLPGKVLEKAMRLEQEAREAGEIGEGLHILVNKLALRGAIGIQKGQGKDEIEMDLDSYDPGLIALTGINGAGKTTLLENMHPFPEMLTRSGKLQDHFRLRDSYRDLYFTDARTGEKYRAFIQIDGANQTGKCEYFLYRNGEPLTNGRKEDYEQKVKELFGSLSLFLRSAFVTQKHTSGNKDLAEASKGERKAIFRELGGLDYLQHYSRTAKEKADTFEGEILRDKGKVEALESLVTEIPERERQLEEIGRTLVESRAKLGKAEEQYESLRSERDALEVQVRANEKIRQSMEGIDKQSSELGSEQTELVERIESYQIAVKQKPEAETAIRQHEALKAEEAKLHEEKVKVLGEREEFLAEYWDAQDAASEARREIDTKTSEISQKMAVLLQKRRDFLTKIDDLQERLDRKIECPKCGHRFAADQERNEKAFKEAQARVWEIDEKLFPDLDKQQKQLEQQKADIEIPKEPPLPEFDESRLHQIQAQFLNQEYLITLEEIIRKAQEAGVRIEEAQKRIKQIDDQLSDLNKDFEELEKSVDRECETGYERVLSELKKAEQLYITARETVTEYETTHKGLEKQIRELGAKKEELNGLQASIKTKQKEIVEWRYLERACGPDGIQALELDALGPGIAEIANRLLEAAYGSRFQMEFRTTRIGGRGSKTKQIEDFQIVVLDSETGDEQLLETLSGGESVWIRKTLYDAFRIIRTRNTGQQFLTVMLDEADGALDPEARIAYFRLLEAAHQESGCVHTIVISHSEAAQEMIPQKIEMSELASSVILAEQVAG